MLSRCLFILLLIYSGQAKADKFKFSATCIEAQNEIFQLRLNNARTLIAKAKTEDKSNPVPFFLEGYIDFFEGFIKEEQELFKAQESAHKTRLEKMEKADKSSPYYLFTQAELKLQRALVRVKFGEYLNAGLDLNSAYKDLKRNSQLFPEFKPNNKTLGMIETLAGTVPAKFQWVISGIGIEASIDKGMKKLTDFVEVKNLRKEELAIQEEALFILAFLRLHITKDPEKAWKMVDSRTADFDRNLMHTYIRASVAKGAKMNDEAVRVLKKRPLSKEFMEFYYLDYLQGVCMLQKLDMDADISFMRFVTFFKGRNYIKDAYQRLSWIAALKKDKKQYLSYLSLLKRHGYTDVDEDKVALRHADETELPEQSLLTARLLFDGGYYQRAYNGLSQHTSESYSTLKDKLEFSYRMGRICHEWGRHSEAIDYYKQTVEKGKNEEWYFAANSQLCIGQVYEKVGQVQLARDAYQKCIDGFSKNKEYRNSIENKARAGIKRLEGK